MTQARGYHRAIILPNGKVLVVGGQIPGKGTLADAELFDPVTRTWKATGFMLFGRSYHTATLLSNGKVIVAGGHCDSGALQFVEMYDPETGKWKGMRPMSVAREWHTATLLGNGNVLIAGGVDASWRDPIATAELFDFGLTGDNSR